MRILAATVKHENNSFSPVLTDMARFEAWGLYRDADALAAYRGTAMPVSAYSDLADSHDAAIVCPVIAEAMPSGLVQEETYEQLCEWILAPLREGVTTSDNAALTYRNLRRPIHPLDPAEKITFP